MSLRDDREVPESHVSEVVVQALRSGDAQQLAGAMSNDLQAAALSLRPSLHRLLDAGMEYGALAGMVSGSGPTCAFLVRDDEHALDVAVALTASGACRTVKRAHGPVAGAKVKD